MQTFMPYACFQKTAEVLDYRRLGKQRVECKQILLALSDRRQIMADLLNGVKIPKLRAWLNHPCTIMWEGFEPALRVYQRTIIHEWVRRGYQNNMDIPDECTDYQIPPWIGHEKLHSGQRSNLLAKNREHYAQFGWSDPDDLEYFWPNENGYYKRDEKYREFVNKQGKIILN